MIEILVFLSGINHRLLFLVTVSRNNLMNSHPSKKRKREDKQTKYLKENSREFLQQISRKGHGIIETLVYEAIIANEDPIMCAIREIHGYPLKRFWLINYWEDRKHPSKKRKKEFIGKNVSQTHLYQEFYNKPIATKLLERVEKEFIHSSSCLARFLGEIKEVDQKLYKKILKKYENMEHGENESYDDSFWMRNYLEIGNKRQKRKARLVMNGILQKHLGPILTRKLREEVWDSFKIEKDNISRFFIFLLLQGETEMKICKYTWSHGKRKDLRCLECTRIEYDQTKYEWSMHLDTLEIREKKSSSYDTSPPLIVFKNRCELGGTKWEAEDECINYYSCKDNHDGFFLSSPFSIAHSKRIKYRHKWYEGFAYFHYLSESLQECIPLCCSSICLEYLFGGTNKKVKVEILHNVIVK